MLNGRNIHLNSCTLKIENKSGKFLLIMIIVCVKDNILPSLVINIGLDSYTLKIESIFVSFGSKF